MRASRVKAVSGIFGALCVAALLAGCATEQVAEPDPIDTGTAVTPEPVATTAPDTSADVLFTITANVRAVDGRTVGISMSAHQPLASTDAKAKDLRDEFLSVCAAGNGAQPVTADYLRDNGSTLMLVELSTNTPGQTFVQPIDLYFGSPYFAQAATGDGISPEPGQDCYFGYAWKTSGDVRGIADFENPDGRPDLLQWRYGHYGFTVSPDSGATIEACRATITELGAKAGLDQVGGWDVSAAGTGIACGIGYSGE